MINILTSTRPGYYTQIADTKDNRRVLRGVLEEVGTVADDFNPWPNARSLDLMLNGCEYRKIVDILEGPTFFYQREW